MNHPRQRHANLSFTICMLVSLTMVTAFVVAMHV